MPLYVMKCKEKDCGKEEEYLLSFSEPKPKTCPHCKKESLELQIGGSSFHLKGDGWYVTDYKGNK